MIYDLIAPFYDAINAEIDYKKCIYCHKCITACPYKKVEQVTPGGFKKLKKTLDRYNNQN